MKTKKIIITVLLVIISSIVTAQQSQNNDKKVNLIKVTLDIIPTGGWSNEAIVKNPSFILAYGVTYENDFYNHLGIYGSIAYFQSVVFDTLKFGSDRFVFGLGCRYYNNKEPKGLYVGFDYNMGIPNHKEQYIKTGISFGDQMVLYKGLKAEIHIDFGYLVFEKNGNGEPVYQKNAPKTFYYSAGIAMGYSF